MREFMRMIVLLFVLSLFNSSAFAEEHDPGEASMLPANGCGCMLGKMCCRLTDIWGNEYIQCYPGTESQCRFPGDCDPAERNCWPFPLPPWLLEPRLEASSINSVEESMISSTCACYPDGPDGPGEMCCIFYFPEPIGPTAVCDRSSCGSWPRVAPTEESMINMTCSSYPEDNPVNPGQTCCIVYFPEPMGPIAVCDRLTTTTLSASASASASGSGIEVSSLSNWEAATDLAWSYCVARDDYSIACHDIMYTKLIADANPRLCHVDVTPWGDTMALFNDRLIAVYDGADLNEQDTWLAQGATEESDICYEPGMEGMINLPNMLCGCTFGWYCCTWMTEDGPRHYCVGITPECSQVGETPAPDNGDDAPSWPRLTVDGSACIVVEKQWKCEEPYQPIVDKLDPSAESPLWTGCQTNDNGIRTCCVGTGEGPKPDSHVCCQKSVPGTTGDVKCGSFAAVGW